PTGERAPPQDDPLRIHLGLRRGRSDGRPVVVLLPRGGAHLARGAPGSPAATVVTGEDPETRGGERLGEGHETGADGAAEAVGHQHARARRAGRAVRGGREQPPVALGAGGAAAGGEGELPHPGSTSGSGLPYTQRTHMSVAVAR